MRIYSAVLLLLCNFYCFSQDYTPRNNDRGPLISKSMVILTNGDTIEIGSLNRFKNDYLFVHESGSNKKLKIDAKSIDKVIHPRQLDYYNASVRTFYLKIWRAIKVKNKYVFAAEIESGYCSLYVNPKGDSYDFLVQRKNEDAASVVHNPTGVGKKWNKAGKKYFEDCPQIVSIIKKSRVENKFHQLFEELSHTVSLYNQKCSNL